MIRRARGVTGNPTVGAMAGITFLGCRNMIGRLTAGNRVVMTTGTNTDGLRVIHRVGWKRSPSRGRGLMTKITVVCGRHMG